jgi:integrase
VTETKRRRSRGEGGIHWDEKRQRFIASVTVGYTPAGKRIVRRGSGKTEAAARARLKQVMRDHEDGLAIAPHNLTVTQIVKDWLAYGLAGRSQRTIDKCTILCETHVIPALGARRARQFSAADVDRWLADKAKVLSTRTLRELHQCLSRAMNRAMARDQVKRNVVALCSVPKGQPGRPSKSFTLDQAVAVLTSAVALEDDYTIVSLVTGARTEEMRALRWSHVDLDGDDTADPPVPPSIEVWRSVRDGGDTKTKKSRRTLALARLAVDALRRQHDRQKRQRQLAGARWTQTDLVFTSGAGTALDAANVRRSFRRTVKAAGLVGDDWTPRELRHSFVSIMSDEGVSLEEIAPLVGHSGTTVTEEVYRHQLRPVLLKGALVMDQILAHRLPKSES